MTGIKKIQKTATATAMALLIAATSVTGLAASSTSKNITFAEAAKIATEEVAGTVTKVEQDYKNRNLVYEVEVLDSSDKEHDLDIEASTGKVLTHKTDRRAISSTNAKALRGATVTAEKAIAAAKKETGASTLIKYELDVERGNVYWEVQLMDTDNVEYEVLLNAKTGKILTVDTDYDD